MITNGSRLADPAFARELARAGLKLVHVSVYSVRPEVEARLRGTRARWRGPSRRSTTPTLRDRGQRQLRDQPAQRGSPRREHPLLTRTTRRSALRVEQPRPVDGPRRGQPGQFTPRLADFELSLGRAMRLLHRSGPQLPRREGAAVLHGEFAWASTETRKIVKGEERIVHFLDAKQTVRQTDWEHRYAPGCAVCSLRPICGGLFDRGDAYDPAELAPQFIDPEPVVRAILEDPRDPSFSRVSLAQWRAAFSERVKETGSIGQVDGLAVGALSPEGERLYAAKRRAEGRKAGALGVAMERGDDGDAEG
jgi:hypothetical protein